MRNDSLSTPTPPPTSPRSTTIGDIRRATDETLRRHIPSDRVVACLDYPLHMNAGDSLIWLGFRTYVSAMHVRVGYVASTGTYRADALRRHLPDDGIILCHGGGNFGDLYPSHQKHREDVVRSFPDHKIVLMPQTMYFTDPRNLAEAQEAYAGHPALTILLRDHHGLDEARRAFPTATVDFCHDLAFGFDVVRPDRPPAVDVALLLRIDEERKTSYSFSFPASVSTRQHDWRLAGVDRLHWELLKLPTRVPRNNRLVDASFDRLGRLNVRRAMSFLSSGRVVITDRLHAAVMCGLAGIPVVCLDSSYGKVSRLYHDYLHDLPDLHLAADTDQAEEIARSYL